MFTALEMIVFYHFINTRIYLKKLLNLFNCCHQNKKTKNTAHMQEGHLCLQSFAGDTEDGKSTLKKEEKEQKLDNFFLQRSYQGLSLIFKWKQISVA